MSWAQIRSAINSNLSRTLDSLINDRFNQQETQINTINTRVGTLDTNLTAATNSIATISTQSSQVINLAARSNTVASNTVQERLVLNPPVQTPTADAWTRAARIITHMPGQYRLNVAGNFSTSHQTVSMRVVNIDGSLVASTSSFSQNTRFINFHMNAGEVFFFEVLHPFGQVAVSLTECSLCYDLVNVPRIAALTRS